MIIKYYCFIGQQTRVTATLRYTEKSSNNPCYHKQVTWICFGGDIYLLPRIVYLGHCVLYYEPNDKICYIYKESNHPPSITKWQLISIESRLSKISSNEKVFNESVSIHQEVLNKSGCNHKLKFQQTSTNNTQRRWRKRNVIWFKLPFSKSIVTKIGKVFLRLINKHFRQHYKLHKLFNRNNVKISYDWMRNV